MREELNKIISDIDDRIENLYDKMTIMEEEINYLTYIRNELYQQNKPRESEED